MAFPVVETTAVDTTAAGTSVAVDLPASIAAGDLLLLFVRVIDGTISTPADWSVVYNEIAGAGPRAALFWKEASGSEGTSVTIDTSNSHARHTNAYRITGWTGTPEATTATGSGTTPDPPSLTPSWGSADTLWIAAANTGQLVSSQPTNYGNTIASPTAVMSSARRELAATSDDPDAGFSQGVSSNWLTATVAVQPTAAASTGRLVGDSLSRSRQLGRPQLVRASHRGMAGWMAGRGLLVPDRRRAV